MGYVLRAHRGCFNNDQAQWIITEGQKKIGFLIAMMDCSIETTNIILIPGNIYFTLLMKGIFIFVSTNNMLGYDSKEGVNYV